jgi:superfamily I DNA/RNA helicase
MSSYDSLSEKQRDIVFEKTGKFVVRACPGSGKTYSVAARFADQIENWEYKYRGIASISFTNVAWQEVESTLNEVFNVYTPVRYPHFLGTIDSFINRHIFLPYGHLILGCDKRPTLVGPPHGNWSGDSFSASFFDKISIDINGNFYALNPRAMPRNWESNNYIISFKKRFLKAGYATQSDANYFSLKILQEHPSLAKSLALRFPKLIIDEAQDTSRIQLNIIELLIENGLANVMMVGDYDQAIYEWNEAKPELLNQKFTEWKDNSLKLNENRRSSQKICDFTYNISSLDKPSIAINEEIKNSPIDPLIIRYEQSSLQDTITYFLEMCKGHDIAIDKNNVAILSRSKTLVKEILGAKIILPNELPWQVDKSYVKEIAYGKYLMDNSEFNKGFKYLEKGLYKALYGPNYCSEEDLKDWIRRIGIVNLRTNIYSTYKILPSTSNTTISNWILNASSKLRENNPKIDLSIKQNKGNKTFDDLFKGDKELDRNLPFQLGTVHSVKGETFEAVLLFLKQKGIGKHYRTMLRKGYTTEDHEELRIVYVGITRPRKLLVMAVPDQKNFEAWNQRMFPED